MEEKCQHRGQRDRFCGHCGEQLREICPECGQWERIGRKTCLKRLKKRRDILIRKIKTLETEGEKISEKAKPLRIIEAGLAFFVLSLLVIYVAFIKRYLCPYFVNSPWVIFISVFVGAALITLAVAVVIFVNTQAKKRAKEEFFNQKGYYKICKKRDKVKNEIEDQMY